MKKRLLLIIFLLVLPLVLALAFHLFYPQIPFRRGMGLSASYMNRDILVEMHGLYKSIDVEEYVLGVLANAIPPDYEPETVRAQAVLIRTNVLREMEEKNTKDSADLSYDYLPKEDREKLWGKRNFNKWEAKFAQAVSTSAGMVVKSEGNLIIAAYHEVSIGKTVSAKEILDEDVSYLQSVESSHDVEAKNYMKLITYTYKEISNLLSEEKQVEEGVQTKDIGTGESDVAGDNMTESSVAEDSTGKSNVAEDGTGESGITDNNNRIAIIIEESTDNGFVKKVSIDGKAYTGEEVMRMLELPSDNYYVEEIEGGIRFVCLGKGNCLGLSQYGANVMALEGKSMEEMIAYYYKDVTIEKITNN